MAHSAGKNRRYRHAKISEHRLRRVVACFAQNKTATETVSTTKLSAPTVNLIFHRLREQMRDHGLFAAQFDGRPHPLKVIFDRKHRGVPEHLHDLHAIEAIHRVLCAQRLKGFERLSASNPTNIEKAARLLRFDNGQTVKRYKIWEALKPEADHQGSPNTRPFDPRHIRQDSDILINELHASPQDAFSAYLWSLLLKHPL